MTESDFAAGDRQEIGFRMGDQEWVISWHPATFPPPSGRSHGSSAICVTSEGDVVLVSQDGESWDLPGGRPEASEDWRETLDREVLEEACAEIEDATLLGFTRGVCKSGPEKGLILVRAAWHATVSLHEWDPQHEMSHRRLAPFQEAIEQVTFSLCPRPVFQRIFQEASAIAASSSSSESGESSDAELTGIRDRPIIRPRNNISPS